MWLIPIRPDINYSVKELSRTMKHPTNTCQSKLRQLLRYLKGTLDYRYDLTPKITSVGSPTTDVVAFVDSDWVGCRTTRNSTSGGVIQIWGTTVHHFSRTQASIATSSAEAELYAIGTGVAEALSISHFLVESKLATKTTLIARTDSTSAKAIAGRLGLSKSTKHIQLRYLYMQDMTQAGLL